MHQLHAHYHGYIFSDPLRLQWAIFFDKLNIEYDYHHYFDEVDPQFPPVDFFLPDLDLIVDVRRDSPTRFERSLQADIGKQAKVQGTFRVGPPARQLSADELCSGDDFWAYLRSEPDWDVSTLAWNEERYEGFEYDDGPMCFCTCPECGAVGFEYFGRGERVCGDSCGGSVKRYTYDSPLIHEAAREAAKVKLFDAVVA